MFPAHCKAETPHAHLINVLMQMLSFIARLHHDPEFSATTQFVYYERIMHSFIHYLDKAEMPEENYLYAVDFE
jgi:hypothetical protein